MQEERTLKTKSCDIDSATRSKFGVFSVGVNNAFIKWRTDSGGLNLSLLSSSIFGGQLLSELSLNFSTISFLRISAAFFEDWW